MKRFMFMLGLLLSTLYNCSTAKVLLCDSKIEDKVCKNVSNVAKYRVDISPLPLPTPVRIDTNILDILKVDKTKQTLIIKLKLRLSWTDPQLGVYKSPEQLSK